MAVINRVASVPLILSDPYFSIWSPADHLYDIDTQSWTGKEIPIRGYITVDQQVFRFMGKDEKIPTIEQTNLDISPTRTTYQFENDLVTLELTFAVNLDLSNLVKISEPITMIQTKISKKNPASIVQIDWQFTDEICQDSPMKETINWQKLHTETSDIVWMGKSQQTPLNSTGDLIDIDWGYFYIAAQKSVKMAYYRNGKMLEASYVLDDEVTFLVGYDDIHAINYFGTPCNALWKEKHLTMYNLLENYLNEIPKNLENCQKIDQEIQKNAIRVGGETLEFLTSLSYRQSICAHKLIRNPEGEIIFLSKECSSNGCIGTVDISYPSMPLYLLYQPELVKGMMRPVYHFANLPVWEYDFAPHDVGRYPYVTGQVYSLNEVDNIQIGRRDTIFDYYALPAGQKVYLEEHQMPIEESGNMLIMNAATFLIDQDEVFFTQHLTTNLKWADYLLAFGQDPKNQLCTDDFAGHLAHNANLALKAINALALFGKALVEISHEKASIYQGAAKEMAQIWLQMANSGEKTKLAFDQEDSWSLKYNMIWDQLFELNLFNQETREQEVDHYLAQINDYGTPLDSRKTYTKADWIMWTATLSEDKEKFETMIAPIKKYLEESNSRVPFSDWYDTVTADVMNFKNRTVVGAIFMPLLKEQLLLEGRKNV